MPLPRRCLGIRATGTSPPVEAGFQSSKRVLRTRRAAAPAGPAGEGEFAALLLVVVDDENALRRRARLMSRGSRIRVVFVEFVEFDVDDIWASAWAFGGEVDPALLAESGDAVTGGIDVAVEVIADVGVGDSPVAP
jgi:hypothetical protein